MAGILRLLRAVFTIKMKIHEAVIFLLILNNCEASENTLIRDGQNKHCRLQKVLKDLFLNCSHGNLGYIPKVDSDVQGLIFGYNNLTNVTQETFSNMSNPENIIELQLDHNKIQNISSNAFDSFTHLKFLFLSNNPIYYDNFKLVMGSLSTFRDLTHLKISGIWTITIQSDLFSLMKENYIETLETRFYNMKEFYMEVFKPFNRLRTLYLRDNCIETLKPFPLKNLFSLYIDHNKLKVVPDLSVNGNESDCYFPHLEILDIQNNSIRELQPESFKCLRVLRHMKLGVNPVVLLPNNFLSKLPQIYSLSVRNLYGGRLIVKPFAFNSSSLTELQFEHDGPAADLFVSLSDTFKFSPNLELLNMARISMLYLSSGQFEMLFSPLANMRIFRCFSCKISLDPKYIVTHMKYVKKLFIQSNLITSISEETFEQNKHLEVLSLRFNQIGHIPEAALPIPLLNTLSSLDLSMNPFICDCELEWLIMWMKTKQNSSKIARYPQEYVCSKPEGKYHMHLSDVSFTYKECHPWNPWIWVAVIASPCAVVLGIAAAVIYRNRWNIKHYIFLLRKRRGYQQIPGDTHIYDAFVAYEVSDSKWVRQSLLPVLEDDVGLKLCIHERDFLAGTFINDNIVNNIEASKKVIVVLTNSFAQSGWCMFELKVAHSKLIEDGAELVVILLEKIDARNMNNSLRVLFDTTTYIEWTEDQVGKELFWAKLKDALQK